MAEVHPTQEQLKAFSLGLLDPQQASVVETHLSRCSPCGETLLGLSSDDTFVVMLQRARPPALHDAAVAQQEPPSDLPEGLAKHPRYHIVGLLGRGGMGDVYKAEHRMMERCVALKVIKSELIAKRDAIERFQREVKAAAKLSHANIVTAYDAEQAGENHFLVMEYVDGVNLSEFVNKNGPLSVRQACDYIRQAALGLQHAHEKGMVHRDIKPHNLMVTRCGAETSDSEHAERARVKILDFGLASLASSSNRDLPDAAAPTELTAAGAIMGTPDFISPEQATDAASVDIRSDIYSLGATLFYLLSGRAPFPDGNAMQKLKQHAESQPPSIRDLRADVSSELAAIISRMLAKDPDARYQTPAELAVALAPLADSSLSGSDGQTSGQIAKPQWSVAALAVLVLLLATALVFNFSSPTGLLPSSVGDPPLADNGSAQPLDGIAAAKSPPGSDEPADGQSPQDAIAHTPQLVAVPIKQAALPVGDYHYFTADVSSLQFDQNEQIGLTAEQRRVVSDRNRDSAWIWTYVGIDGPGEAYLSPPQRGDDSSAVRIAVRIPSARQSSAEAVSAVLVMPAADGESIWQLPFQIDSSAWKTPRESREFFEIQQAHYEFLLSQPVPGAAWFRYRARMAAAEIADSSEVGLDDVERDRSRTGTSLEHSFGLLSGGVALSENLRLDEVIKFTNETDSQIPISSIRGITLNEVDWGELNRDSKPLFDRLASTVPADQHAFFFPSFAAMSTTLDHANRDGLHFLQLVRLEGQQSDLLAKYQLQLGLSLNELARLLGPQLVESVAVTGGDPYFDTGTDVAIIFEPSNTAALRQLLEAQIALVAAQHGDCHSQREELDGILISSQLASDRSICSYLATIGDNVIVTNSHAQLQRLIATQRGQTEALDATPEYTFFRNRYPVGRDESSGLLVITDATIRRWCSPTWRIGAARRLFARAGLASIQAQRLDALRHGQGAKPFTPTDHLSVLTGPVRVTADDVLSEEYGSLSFLTPIIELDLALVSAAEKKSYEKWRGEFERAWRGTFDPAAIDFHLQPDRWSADLTILPLTARSQYRMAMAISNDAVLSPQAADPHPESIAHWTMSIDKDSWLMKFLGEALTPELPPPLKADPFAWFGSTISMYMDADAFWHERKGRHVNLFAWAENAPLAVSMEIADRSSMLPFLLGLRKYIDQTAPGLTEWETRNYGEYSYTCVTVRNQRATPADGESSRQSIYYAITGRLLVISPNQSLIERAFDRAAQPDKAGSQPDTVHAAKDLLADERWLGKNIAVQLDGEFMPAIQANFEQQLRESSWKNLPILNEWHALFSAEPLSIHTQFFKRQLRCLGGGQYAWSNELRSMVSSVLGPPGSPVPADELVPPPFRNVETAAFGITFENDGLRARINMLADPSAAP